MNKFWGIVRQEGLGKLKKFIHHIGSRTRNLPSCSAILNHYDIACRHELYLRTMCYTEFDQNNDNYY
jgi:hypothetical protein